MSHAQQIKDDAAEAMRRADEAADAYPTEPPTAESAAPSSQQQQQRDEAAAEAMRRADVAYTKDDDEL
ncbi:hypothetical protein NESM_000486500 [Novymonas esmeraldas]|uniref:Uncharacterized protein n=1 Tax=Novymonas esmeraldas TaxID=1808958 RepID=A0AAW0EPF1_9TRYP